MAYLNLYRGAALGPRLSGTISTRWRGGRTQLMRADPFLGKLIGGIARIGSSFLPGAAGRVVGKVAGILSPGRRGTMAGGMMAMGIPGGFAGRMGRLGAVGMRMGGALGKMALGGAAFGAGGAAIQQFLPGSAGEPIPTYAPGSGMPYGGPMPAAGVRRRRRRRAKCVARKVCRCVTSSRRRGRKARGHKRGCRCVICRR